MAVSELRGLYAALAKTDCNLVAVSTDSLEAHRVFATTCLRDQDIPLVEDRTGEITRSFQVYNEASHSAVPTTFILDGEGKVMASIRSDSQTVEKG